MSRKAGKYKFCEKYRLNLFSDFNFEGQLLVKGLSKLYLSFLFCHNFDNKYNMFQVKCEMDSNQCISNKWSCLSGSTADQYCWIAFNIDYVQMQFKESEKIIRISLYDVIPKPRF